MEIMSNVVEAILIFYLLRQLLPTKKEKLVRQIVGMVLLMLYITAMNQWVKDTSVKGILILLAQVLYAFSCYDGTGMQRVISGMAFTGVAVLADRITFRVAGAIQISRYADVLEAGQVRAHMMVIYLISCLVLTLILGKIHCKTILLSRKHQLLLYVVVVAGAIALDKLLGLAILVHDWEVISGVARQIEIIGLLMMVILCFFLLEIHYMGQVFWQNQELKERHIMESFERKEYEMLKASSETMREWKHDMKSQMQTLTHLAQQENCEGVQHYVQSLYGNLEHELIAGELGNPVLNAVILSRKMRADQLGIPFDYQIVWSEKIVLGEAEFSALLGNLLDNALEASERLPHSANPYVKIEIAPYHKMVKILTENRFDGVIEQDAGQFVSVKKDAGHGIGTRRIRKLTEMCGGILDYQMEKTIFRVKVLIPMGECEDEAD